jgi:hypothetical protein
MKRTLAIIGALLSSLSAPGIFAAVPDGTLDPTINQ